MTGPLPSAEGLDVRHGTFRAPFDVGLRADHGACAALVGSNGPGKSALIEALAGLLRPSGGTVRRAGEAAHGLATREVVRRGAAPVPEGGRLVPSLTVEEELLVGDPGGGPAPLPPLGPPCRPPSAATSCAASPPRARRSRRRSGAGASARRGRSRPRPRSRA